MIGRIRTVKPEIFAHYLLWHLGEVLDMPKLAYWYIGLWTQTDREARFEWKPMELKAALAPFDAVDFSLVLNALANAGFVVRYRVGSRLYGWVPRFLDHQNINGREHATRLPAPPRNAESWHEARMLLADFDQLNVDELLAEPATLDDRPLDAERSAAAERQRRSRERRPAEPPVTRDSDRPHAQSEALDGGAFVEHSEVEGSANAAFSTTYSDGDGSTTREARVSHATQPEQNGTEQNGTERNGATTVAPPAGLVVLDDSARNVPALPAIRGRATALAIKERMALVFGEVHAGTRTRMKREQLRRLNAEVVFLYWQARFDHPGAILTPSDKRRARIEARLKENDDNVSELLYALDGAFHDDHIMARGRYEGETRYDGIDTILRDRAQVEKFAARRKSFVAGKPHKALADLLAELGATDIDLHPEDNGNGKH